MSSHTKEQFDKITGNKEKAKELEREIKRLVDYGDKQEYYKQDVLKAELKGLRDGREGVIKEIKFLEMLLKWDIDKENATTDKPIKERILKLKKGVGVF